MQSTLLCLIALGALSASNAEAQYGYGYNPFHYGLGYFSHQNFPANYPIPNFPYQNYPNLNSYSREQVSSQPSFEVQPYGKENEARFGTLTWTWATTTSTSTVTYSTTCTTSTKSLKVCTPSGGRRRRMVELSQKGRSIFYNADEGEEEEDSIFLPPAPKVEKSPVDGTIRAPREDKLVPFVIPPGFDVPEELGTTARFWVQLGTSTSITTTTSSYTYSLTATCASTTGYQVCGSSGRR